MVLHWALLLVLLGTATANDICQSKEANFKDYTGPINKSKTGLECKKWSIAPSYKSTGEHNMCRNPDGDSIGVWCYTEKLAANGQSWEHCDVPMCDEAVDGDWSAWGDYEACSATCGQATKKRERTCTAPAPKNGGAQCDGPSQETVECGLPECVGSAYKKMEYANFCSGSWDRITSETECKYAASALNLKWGQSWNGPGDFPGCLHSKDARNMVYFNTSPNPSKNPNNNNYAEICQTDFRDCTEHFKNRLASFEYTHQQGQWLYPYWYKTFWGKTRYAVGKWSAKVSQTRTSRDIQWNLHDCGEGAVCAETKKWENYFMVKSKYVDVAKDTNIGSGSNKNKHMAIFCQSCQPNPGTYTYNQCQLRMHPEDNNGKKYALRGYKRQWHKEFDYWSYRFGTTCSTCAWTYFRIESPPTREFMNVIFDKCNKNADSIEVTKTIKSSITTSQSTTTSTKVKLTLGLEAAYYVKAAIGLEAQKTYSRTNMQKISEEHEEEFQMDVPRGKRLIIKQLVAEAAYVTIRTQKYVTFMTDC